VVPVAEKARPRKIEVRGEGEAPAAIGSRAEARSQA